MFPFLFNSSVNPELSDYGVPTLGFKEIAMSIRLQTDS